MLFISPDSIVVLYYVNSILYLVCVDNFLQLNEGNN